MCHCPPFPHPIYYLSVTPGSRTECKRHQRVKASGSVGYIASLDTVENNYGSADCPWRIEVSKGQRVNLTLYNFARGRHADVSEADGTPPRTDVCYELAEIREDGSKRRMTLCDGLERHTPVYVSRGNVIDVQLVSGGTLETLGYFLIKYQGRSQDVGHECCAFQMYFVYMCMGLYIYTRDSLGG